MLVEAGDRVDLTPFALPSQSPRGFEWDAEAGARILTLEWNQPREIHEVIATFAMEAPLGLRVQYWHKNWPTPAPERHPGARRGWIGRDDPWHGRWVTARGELCITGETAAFRFDPIDRPELPWLSWQVLEDAEDYLAPFRRTLKLRLVVPGEPQPVLEDLAVLTGSRWQEGEVDLLFGVEPGTGGDWSGGAVVADGYLLDVTPLDCSGEDTITSEGGWRCHIAAGGPKGVRLRLLYGAETLVTVRTAACAFTLRVLDLDQCPIYLPDYGVYAAWTGRGQPLDAYRKQVAADSKSIYIRVFDEPEQSLTRSMSEMPSLDVVKQDSYTGLGRYLPLALEAGRQEFAVRHNGELFVDKSQLKLSGRDAARLLWAGAQMRFRFGSGDPPDFREPGHRTEQSLLDGWLPVVISRWVDREISFEETVFVAPFDSSLPPVQTLRGDEDVVAWVRFVIRNTTAGRKRAQLWVASLPQEALALEGGRYLVAQGRVAPDVPVARQWRVDAYPCPRLRCIAWVEGDGMLRTVPFAEEPGQSRSTATALLYSADLEGGESRTITLAVPFAAPAGREAWEALAAQDYRERFDDVTTRWRGYVESGGQMQVPDTVLSDFHKAARVHVGITVDRDPVNGLYIVPAATWSYGACGNEACWQITMLDQAGHHDRSRAYLDTFLQTQGIACPDGRFEDKTGALVSVDFDGGAPVMGSFAYNLDHGFILECLVDHYRYTGDLDWLQSVTPALIAACDFIIRERARTMETGADGECDPAWGLLPAGHLEDNPEWRHWFAVNAHAYAGLRAVADVLGVTGHKDAERLDAAAESYRDDIRQAARRAMVEAPVVRLLDGTCVPHIPTRTGIRGREWGWFREAAYGSLHLLEGGVFDPDAPEMTWVLKDLEDNLFVSREWGRPVDVVHDWFSRGGVTIQPNLMDLSIDYLRRGEVKHALRALFNNFASSLYPDVRTFTEHPVTAPGHGVGPFYKSSDESKALIWLRHCLLHEEGTTLHLAAGVPEAWFVPGQTFSVRRMATFFGPVTYHVEAEAERVRVTVTFADPDRRPTSLVVHLRRPGDQPLLCVGGGDRVFTIVDGTLRIVHPDPTTLLDVYYQPLV